MDREQDQKRVRESMKAGGRRQEAEGKLIALSFNFFPDGIST
ncbi:hypothetical protein [Nostoc sp. LEGE 12450]|nr:hypothetical protein [Nostoc sp. LEGE 12450]